VAVSLKRRDDTDMLLAVELIFIEGGVIDFHAPMHQRHVAGRRRICLLLAVEGKVSGGLCSVTPLVVRIGAELKMAVD
jgi:hypothetical protein